MRYLDVILELGTPDGPMNFIPSVDGNFFPLYLLATQKPSIYSFYFIIHLCNFICIKI